MHRRSAIGKQQSSGARISRLENRINDLVSQLHSPINGPGSLAAPSMALNEDDAQQQLISPPQDNQCISTDDVNNDIAPQRASSPDPTLPSQDPSRPTITLDPSMDDGEAYLEVFRSRMLPHFAFVHIPASVSAQQLRRDRPFLFHAMVAVVSPSVRDQVARGREFRRMLADTALEENQSNMDLLLGLLTYIAWGWDSFLNRSGLSRLMMLAMSVVTEMRLNKPVPFDARTTQLLATGSEHHHIDNSTVTSQRLLERGRAVLGCFILSSRQVL